MDIAEEDLEFDHQDGIELEPFNLAQVLISLSNLSRRCASPAPPPPSPPLLSQTGAAVLATPRFMSGCILPVYAVLRQTKC